MLPADRLYRVARSTLDTVVDHFTDEAVALPARRFVCDGLPAWDCEQLVTWVDRVYVGTVDAEAVRSVDCYHERVAVVGVLLVRCTPNVPKEQGQRVLLPAPAEIESHTQVVLADATLVENALLEHAGEFGLGGHRGMAFESWQRQGPEGGFSGGLLRVRLSLTVAVP